MDIFSDEIWENICDDYFIDMGNYDEKPNYKLMKVKFFASFFSKFYAKITMLLFPIIILCCFGYRLGWLIGIITFCFSVIILFTGSIGIFINFLLLGCSISLIFNISMLYGILISFLLFCIENVIVSFAEQEAIKHNKLINFIDYVCHWKKKDNADNDYEEYYDEQNNNYYCVDNNGNVIVQVEDTMSS